MIFLSAYKLPYNGNEEIHTEFSKIELKTAEISTQKAISKRR